MKLFISVAVAVAAASAYTIYKRHQTAKHYASIVAGLAEPHKYKDALVIVVDVGSSSIRASLYALVRKARYETNEKPQEVEWVMLRGSMQQLVLEDIMDSNGEADIYRIENAVEAVIDRVLKYIRAAGLEEQVMGIGFSTFVMNFLGVDAQGVAVTPIYTYAGRRPSTAEHAKKLREILTYHGCLEECHNRIGTVIHPAYAPAQFMRLASEEPNIIAHVVKWQSISSYLLRKWMLVGENGPLPISYTEASWMGILNFRKSVWDDQLLGIVRMDACKMPELQDSSIPFSGLRPVYAKRWPELANKPFFLGIGDGAAANIGSKCIDSSRIAVTVGTSAALRVVLDDSVMSQHRVPKGLWCYRITKSKVMVGGALNDGGSIFGYFGTLLQLVNEDLEEKLNEQYTSEHGLTMLPFLSGERAPGWRDEATCTITGITKWTKPIDFVQAGMEAVAMRVAHVFSLLAGYADSDAIIITSGTALTASRVWRQMIADSIGREVIMDQNTAVEATSRGVAVLVGTYLNRHTLDDTEGLVSEHLVRSSPCVKAHTKFLRARLRQEVLYRTLYIDE